MTMHIHARTAADAAAALRAYWAIRHTLRRGSVGWQVCRDAIRFYVSESRRLT